MDWRHGLEQPFINNPWLWVMCIVGVTIIVAAVLLGDKKTRISALMLLITSIILLVFVTAVAGFGSDMVP